MDTYTNIWRRGAAFLIDMVIVVTVFCLLIHVVNILLGLPVEYSSIWERGISLVMTPYVNENFWQLVLLYSLIKLSVILPYFTLLESSRRQATVGKMIVGCKVIDKDGQRISFLRALGRLVGKLISGQLLIGFLIIPFMKKRQGLHDLLAGTFVVDVAASSSYSSSLAGGRKSFP